MRSSPSVPIGSKPKQTRFERVNYKSLKAKQKELFSFQKISATFADFGFNCIKLADDWQGADFLAYHLDGITTLKVQLKSRITIEKKYRGKDIWIAFPHDNFWYLIEHDTLERKIGNDTHWLDRDSWRKSGKYSSTSINPKLLASLEENRLGQIYGLVTLDRGRKTN